MYYITPYLGYFLGIIEICEKLDPKCYKLNNEKEQTVYALNYKW